MGIYQETKKNTSSFNVTPRELEQPLRERTETFQHPPTGHKDPVGKSARELGPLSRRAKNPTKANRLTNPLRNKRGTEDTANPLVNGVTPPSGETDC